MNNWKRLFLIFLICILPITGFSADVKISDLPLDAAPTADDLLIIVDEPGGVPVTKKATIGSALAISLGWIDSSSYASVNAAVAAIGATQKTLVVSTAETLTANLTIPATLNLVILKGGSIIKASTYTLTINGPFEAGLYQVFSGFSAGNVTFGSGAVKEVLAQWWGAVGDGATDDGPEFQCALDSINAAGGIIFVPSVATYYLISTQVDITKPVTMIGGDVGASEFSTATDSLVMFTTTAKFTLRNLGFSTSGAAAGTATGFKVLAASTTAIADSNVENCYFNGFARCFWAERTCLFRIIRNRFAPGGTGRYGLYLENTTNSDEGDTFIHNNFFAGGTDETSILVASTSGLYISNNKFNGAVAVHIDIAPTSNAVGNFVITGNSIEGHATAGIRLIATTGSITKTVITGNQMSSGDITHIIVGNSAWDTIITGNIFNSGLSTTGIGIDIQAGSWNTNIAGNTFYQILTAINSVNSATGQSISGNRFNLLNNATLEVTNFYLGGENGTNEIGAYGSTKEFDIARYVENDSNAVYVNSFQFKGDCIVEVLATGYIQNAGAATKYQKVLVTGDTTITDLIALVSVGSAFDLQIVSSGGFTVIGLKLNGATGTLFTGQIRVKVTGYVNDFSKV